MPLTRVADRLWIHHQNLSLFGIELGALMTVVDLDGKGNLFIHSPNRLTHELRAELHSLGQVNWVISPNKWHHLFVGEYRDAFPSSKSFCAPGLEQKRKDFSFDGIISGEQIWAPALEHTAVKGIPLYNEIVFFHPSTRTLIVTDLAVHICESHSFFTRVFLRAIGSYGKFGWTKLEKKIFVKDREAFTRSLRKIMAWDFDRVLLSHGRSVEKDGKRYFSEAFREYL